MKMMVNAKVKVHLFGLLWVAIQSLLLGKNIR